MIYSDLKPKKTGVTAKAFPLHEIDMCPRKKIDFWNRILVLLISPEVRKNWAYFGQTDSLTTHFYQFISPVVGGYFQSKYH